VRDAELRHPRISDVGLSADSSFVHGAAQNRTRLRVSAHSAGTRHSPAGGGPAEVPVPRRSWRRDGPLRVISMMIDYHTHFMRRAHFGPDFAREWDERGGTGAWPEITAEQYEKALEPVDRAIVFGITAAALGIHTPHEYVAGLVARNPKKFIGFMALDPSRSDAIAEMERGRNEYGMKGIKLYPVMSLYSITDPNLAPFFRRAEELKLPILMHMGTSSATRGLLKYSVPLLADELAVAFPELRMILAHLGHPWQ